MRNFGNKISVSTATNSSLLLAKTIQSGTADFPALLLYPVHNAISQFWILNKGKLSPSKTS